uniref:Uncharacterized protein n=1 Tax=Anguilla anguilla TaxID=7936 RepID=A0A0E9X8M0_ANGAN
MLSSCSIILCEDALLRNISWYFCSVNLQNSKCDSNQNR